MVVLRPATPDDCKLVWEWANDRTAREASFSIEPIPWETHVGWYANQLADPRSLFLIGEADGTPVSQVRFTIVDTAATVSIAVAPTARRYGHGLATLLLATARLFATRDVTLVHAHVKSSNAGSRWLFTKAGFVQQPPDENASSLHFILARAS